MEWVTISVGGSLIYPDKQIDYDFLKSLKKVIESFKNKYKFAICVGGGNIARVYINALRKHKVSKIKQDKIGISCTILNAKLLSLFFGLNQEVPKSLGDVLKISKKQKLVILGGLWPGTTSDGTAAEIGKKLGSKIFINITNVKGLFDKDPKKYSDAKLIKEISHADFNKLVKKVIEKPGQHFVLDSKAARITERANIKVIILNGMNNLRNALSGKSFV